MKSHFSWDFVIAPFQLKNIAVVNSSAKNGNYAKFPTESEFLECTLAGGHFCNIRSALYYMQSYKMCIISLFLKDEIAIEKKLMWLILQDS